MSETQQQPFGDKSPEELFQIGKGYLELLGLEEHADDVVTRPDGTTMMAGDFLTVCGEHALPMLEGLKAMDPEDEKYEKFKGLLRKQVAQYIQVEEIDETT